MERQLEIYIRASSNRKFQAIFASPNRYFTENSRWVPLSYSAVTVASQGETLLLSLFSFCGESGTTVFDWTHLSGCFRDWEFSFSNCLLNSQLLRVDLGSACA